MARRFYNARLLAPSVSSFAASMSAPLFRKIPSATVVSPNTSAVYRQAKGAIQDVVFNTLYILSNTKRSIQRTFHRLRAEKPLLERVEPKGSRGSVKHLCL